MMASRKIDLTLRSCRLDGLSPVCGSPVMPRSGRQGRLALPFGCCAVILYRRGGRGGSVQAPANVNGEAGTLEPAVHGGIVRYSCAASIYRGDRGLQSASEANGKPEHSLALSLSTRCGDKVQETRCGDKVWREGA